VPRQKARVAPDPEADTDYDRIIVSNRMCVVQMETIKNHAMASRSHGIMKKGCFVYSGLKRKYKLK